MVDVARYQYVCVRHGPCGSHKVTRKKYPNAPRCPVCAQRVEIWVGASLPEHEHRPDIATYMRAV
jgi:hypothetical protein